MIFILQLKHAKQVQENVAEINRKQEETTVVKQSHQPESMTSVPSSQVSHLKDAEERGDRLLPAIREELPAVKDPEDKSEIAAGIVSVMKEVLEEKQREMKEQLAVVGSKEQESRVVGAKDVVTTNDTLTVNTEKRQVGNKEQKAKDFEGADEKIQTAEKTPKKTKFERQDETEHKRIEDTLDEKIFEKKNEASGDRIDNQIVDNAIDALGSEAKRLDKLGPSADKIVREPVVTDIVEAAGEPVAANVAAAAIRSVQHSTGSEDSSDPYTDVPNEDEDDEEEERGETETHEVGNRYVRLNNESPQDLMIRPECMHRTSEDESEVKEPIAENADQGRVQADLPMMLILNLRSFDFDPLVTVAK